MLCLDASKYTYVGKSKEGYYQFIRKSKTYEMIVAQTLRYHYNGKLLRFPEDEQRVKPKMNTRA